MLSLLSFVLVVLDWCCSPAISIELIIMILIIICGPQIKNKGVDLFFCKHCI